MLGVSSRTVSRRLAALNLQIRSRYSHISDHLDQIICRLQHEHPNTGYRVMWSMLAACGFYVHGYSRLIVYLKCSSNNRADTVFNLFVTACNNIGIPSRVRSDHGGENILVATFMTLYHGIGRGSHIAGTSIHNQRIEHLWRDVYVSCTCLFYHLFHSLEDCGLLDPENDTHLYALHYVYLPRINPTFLNQHPLTSCNCMTPQQLWMQGMLQNIHSGYTAVDDFFVQHNLSTLALFNTESISGVESENIEIRPTSISLSDKKFKICTMK